MGFLVDTRNYDASRLPSFGPVVVPFAHVWYGSGNALQNEPPSLDAFCCFCGHLQPGHIVLTHLQDFGRNANDYWENEHAQQIKSLFAESRLDISISY